MKLIVGLGNPEEVHKNNRHNVGFMVVDQLVGDDGTIGWERKFDSEINRVGEFVLVKPQTFMNNSGKAVKELVNFYKISFDDVWIIHDDLDIRLGGFKIQKGIGPKVHNGVSSVEKELGVVDFWRVRVGIDNRLSGENRISGEKYTLEDFAEDEMHTLNEVIEKIIQQIKVNLNF